MTVKIDKNVPPPVPFKGIYPWDTMEVGDSFEVPAKDWAATQPLRTNICHRNKRWAPKKWQSKRTPVGLRVWRTA